MRYDYVTVDVFTDRVFGGNPLAVLPAAAGLTDAQMQSIAREFNLSETAFVLPPDDERSLARVRIFTPAVELPFAGHPTVGTAYVLACSGAVALLDGGTDIVLEEQVGPVAVRIESENGQPGACHLRSARAPEFGPGPPPEAVVALLDLAPEDLAADLQAEAVSCGVPFVLVPLVSIDAVGRAQLRRQIWEQRFADEWAEDVFLFAPGGVDIGVDYHARMFGPGVGIAEDPATGAAATALAAYLAKHSGATDGVHRWVVEQGIEMGRPSRMHLLAEVEDGCVRRAGVGGTSVVVARGSIDVG